MEHLPLILLAATLIPLICASAFFSGSETALFSLSRHQRRQLAQARTLTADALNALLADSRAILITLLMGNMIVNVLFFVVSTVLLLHLQEEFSLHAVLMGLLSVAPLVLIILLGEVLPKLLAAHGARRFAGFVAVPLLLAHRGVAPVRILVNALIITPLARLIAPNQAPGELSADELDALLTLSQREGVIDPSEEQLLQQVLDLSQLKVRDLMTPRVDLHAHDLDDPPEALYRIFREERLFRVPVYRDSIDRIEGVVYARQVLVKPPADREALLRHVKTVHFVPEQQRADQLLVTLRKMGVTLAVVVDEYGGTAGLVTLEDVVEHMVGDISHGDDIHDVPEVRHIDARTWEVSGQLAIHEWSSFLGPAARAPGVHTLGGLVMAQLGRPATVGDQIRLGAFEFAVLSVSRTRIDRLRLTLLSRDAQAMPEAADADSAPIPIPTAEVRARSGGRQ